MIAVPRSVISIQSPWRQTPGIHLEVALAVAAAVLVAPEVERHRRHRLGDHELADLADRAACPRGSRPRRGRRARGPAARPGRRAASARRRRTRCRRRCRRRSRTARCRLRAPRRPRRSPRARAATRSSRPRAAPRGRVPRRGSQAGLHAAADEGGAGAEARDARLVGEIPEDAEVGRAGVAVVEHDRRLGVQAADEEVPHHPAGRREPEQPVAGLRGRGGGCIFFSISSRIAAVAVHDRLRQAGRARAVEHPERVVERHLLEARAATPSPPRAELVPARSPAPRPVERRLRVEVAEQHRVLDRRQRASSSRTTSSRSKSLPP